MYRKSTRCGKRPTKGKRKQRPFLSMDIGAYGSGTLPHALHQRYKFMTSDFMEAMRH